MGILILPMSRKVVSMGTFARSIGKKVPAMSIYPFTGNPNKELQRNILASFLKFLQLFFTNTPGNKKGLL
jgi:hypothetical protein